MRGDLKNGIRRGVNNQIAGFHVLFAVLIDNLCTGPRCIGQHAAPRCLAEGLQNLLREAIGIGGQRIRRDDARDLPVTDRSILSHGGLLQAAAGALRLLCFAQKVQTVDVADAAGNHLWDL